VYTGPIIRGEGFRRAFELNPSYDRAYSRDEVVRFYLCDFRPPNVIRVAPVPLYNTFEDVYTFCRALARLRPTQGA
jgi:selenocysteine lyase/cysteine desulfurase